MRSIKLSLIVAFDSKLGIGIHNKLPWNIKDEIKYFQRITKHTNNNSKNNIIMGYNTWNSIPKKNKPLCNRINIILTSNQNKIDILYEQYNNSKELVCYSNIDELLQNIKETSKSNNFLIGGKSIYDLFMLNPYYNKYIKELYITRINNYYECDTFFPCDPKLMSNYYQLIKENKKELYDNKSKTCIDIFFEKYYNKYYDNKI